MSILSTERISLSPRLKAVSDWVAPHSLFADIGTDHGYLPLFLLQEGRISSAIASDINQGPLDSAKHTAQKYGRPLDLRLSDGLMAVEPPEVDCIAVAGMGGMTISHIVEAWVKKYPEPWAGTFLLQPMSTQKELRLWLTQHHFTIVEERTIREGKTLYTVMKVKVGETTAYHQGELLLGRQTTETQDENRHFLLDYWLEKTKKILGKLELSPETKERKEELEEQLSLILALREEWNIWHPQ